MCHEADARHRGPDVPRGAATIALEIDAQLPKVDEIFIPVGDSALIRGVCGAMRSLQPSTRVSGVQAERAPAYYLSWRAGRVITTDTCNTIADGLATRTPSAGNVAALRGCVDHMQLVSDDEMVQAVKLLADEDVVAERTRQNTFAFAPLSWRLCAKCLKRRSSRKLKPPASLR